MQFFPEKRIKEENRFIDSCQLIATVNGFIVHVYHAKEKKH